MATFVLKPVDVEMTTCALPITSTKKCPECKKTFEWFGEQWVYRNIRHGEKRYFARTSAGGPRITGRKRRGFPFCGEVTMHDMTTIVQPINLMVSDELDRASKLHGSVFASPHEGYGVIAEELQEAVTELERSQSIMYQLLKAIHEENGKAIIGMADCIRDRAVNAAAECIQVAAMCEKMGRTVCNEAAL